MGMYDLYTSKEIKPLGWLKRQLEIQAKGLSGNLDKIWPDIRDSAWIGGKCEGWERVPYWLDGFIPLAYLLEDEKMIATAKKYIDAIISKQTESGWICPCEEKEIPKYDTWAVQLICKTLKVYYDCSADQRIPDVIYRVMKNYYELLKTGRISLFGWGKFRWFESFVSLDFLYEMYREEWIKELAEILRKQGFDYNETIESWKKTSRKWKMNTHIVNLTMMLKSEAVTYELLGEKYTDSAEKLREILDKYNGTAFEGFTGDEVLSGLDPTKGTELCSVVEQMYSYELLYAYTGDKKWVERLEVLAFNALPATMSEDMWSHQYVQMVNQIACQKTKIVSPFGTNGREAHLFGLEPNYGCCTANFSQGWPKFALSAFMHKDNTVISSVMLPCILKDNGIIVRVETEYPFKNKASYLIESDRAFDFEVRIPSFAKNLKINDEDEKSDNLIFAITPGKTELVLDFDTVPVLKKRPGNMFALQMGSLLFSVPLKYKKKMIEYTKKGVERKFPYCDYQYIPESSWNYGFAGTDFTVVHREVGDVPFSEKSPPVTVKADMQQIKWGYKFPFRTVCAKKPASLNPVSTVEQIKLYPYGCSKLRMTEMPLLKK